MFKWLLRLTQCFNCLIYALHFKLLKTNGLNYRVGWIKVLYNYYYFYDITSILWPKKVNNAEMGTMQIYQCIASGWGCYYSLSFGRELFRTFLNCYDIFSNLVSHFVVHDKWKLKKVNIYLCIVRDCTCIDGTTFNPPPLLLKPLSPIHT